MNLPTKKLTKQDIAKMIEELKKLEGKEVVAGKPIDLSGNAAWYIAYGTKAGIADVGGGGEP